MDYNIVMLIAIIVVDILMAGSFLIRFSRLPPEIPLFYSQAWGENQLIDTVYIFLLPLFMHLFILINNYVYRKFFLPNQYIRKIIEILNWFAIIVFTAIFVRILFFIT